MEFKSWEKCGWRGGVYKGSESWVERGRVVWEGGLRGGIKCWKVGWWVWGLVGVESFWLRGRVLECLDGDESEELVYRVLKFFGGCF